MSTTNNEAPMTHDEAMDLISKAITVTVISYEEAIAIYLRARRFLRDGSPVLGAPVPDDWAPQPVIDSVRDIMKKRGVYDEMTGERDVNAVAISAIVASHHYIDSVRQDSAPPISGVVQEIAAERQRQIYDECFTHEMDDCYVGGELAAAASAYAYRARCETANRIDHLSLSHLWPNDWQKHWWKTATPRRMLVKAAAMLVAEIERIDRAAAKGGEA